jgi:hypothetical protein
MLNGFVELPGDVQLSITLLITAFVGLVILYIGQKLPWSLPILEKYKEVIALDLSALLILWLQNALPTGSDEISILAVKLVVAALTLWLGFQALIAGSRKARLLNE